DAHEAGIAALVRARRHAVLVAGGQEEHVPSLDEGAVALADGVGDQPLLDAVGQAAGVEQVLQLAAALVEHAEKGTPGVWLRCPRARRPGSAGARRRPRPPGGRL